MNLKQPKPERKKRTESGAKPIARRIVIIAVILALLGLAGSHVLFLVTKNDLFSKPQSIAARVIAPIQTGFSGIVQSVVDYLYKLKYRSNIELAYNQVKDENEQLSYQAMLAAELQNKLTVYENMFDEISVNESMNPLVATVINHDQSNYFSVFTINKGSKDGVKEYMAVTMDGALIGYTYNVTTTTSAVRTIIDSQASIAALISSTRDQGTVRGTLGVDGTAMCRMYYLPDDHLPRPGDTVVTSGVGMSFPKGIPIGTVRESTRGMESNKSYIVVEPTADFEHIEYVLVLRYQPQAEAVQARTNSSDSLTFTPVDTELPIPTIQIGSDFYQLAPTPAPSVTPAATQDNGGDTQPTTVAPEVSASPAPSTDNGNVEYQVPSSMATENTYGFTLAPTATPSPTPPPLDVSVEEDQ